MLQIKYVPVENAIAEWGNKEAVCKRFEGLRPKTLDALLVEMRKNPKFSSFVINPSHKIVWINFEGFLNYLKYRQNHRYEIRG